MTTSVTLNGTTYTSPTDFAGTAYVTKLIEMLESAMADITRALTTTSTTEESIGTGSKTFTMAQEVPFGVGAFVVVADTAAPTTNYMWGQVSARSGTSLTVNVIATAGSGTKTAWTISISGSRGVPGTLSGTAAGAIDMAGYQLTANLITHKTGTEHLPSATSTPTAVSGAQSLTLLSYTTHIINIDGDTTLTVSAGTTTNHLTDCTLLVVNQGGWALTISGASELDGDTVDLTDMTTGQKAQFAFHMPADGAILYWRYGAYR